MPTCRARVQQVSLFLSLSLSNYINIDIAVYIYFNLYISALKWNQIETRIDSFWVKNFEIRKKHARYDAIRGGGIQ